MSIGRRPATPVTYAPQIGPKASYGSNAPVGRYGLQLSSNNLNVDAPIRLEAGDQLWGSLLARALIGLRHRLSAVCSSCRKISM